MVDTEGFDLALMNLYVLWLWKEFEKSGPVFLALLRDYMNSSGRRAAAARKAFKPKGPRSSICSHTYQAESCVCPRPSSRSRLFQADTLRNSMVSRGTLRKGNKPVPSLPSGKERQGPNRKHAGLGGPPSRVFFAEGEGWRPNLHSGQSQQSV